MAVYNSFQAWMWKPDHNTGNHVPYSCEQCVGSLTSHKVIMNKGCETGPTIYRPYPRRLDSLTICRYDWQVKYTFLLYEPYKPYNVLYILPKRPILFPCFLFFVGILKWCREGNVRYLISYINKPIFIVWTASACSRFLAFNFICILVDISIKNTELHLMAYISPYFWLQCKDNSRLSNRQ